MRNSDVYFLSVMGLAITIALSCAFLGCYQNWMGYWYIGVLLPIGFIKAFSPKSKFTKWLEKKVTK